MNCRTCNTRIPGRSNVCPNCGRSVVNAPRRDLPGSVVAAGPSPPSPAGRGLRGEPVTTEGADVVSPSPKLTPSELIALLAAQPGLLEPGLRVPMGQTGASHQLTDVGQIDLLLADAKGDLVVVMVPESDSAGGLVVEVLRRIGWVRRHRAGGDQSVRGVVLLPAETGPAGYAVAALAETVAFKTYRMVLRFDACRF